MWNITKEQLLEVGAHFGHQTKKWNPKMKPYIFTQKNGVYIINLEKTKEKLIIALDFINSIAKKGGKVLFVGTKKQAQLVIKEQAIRSNSFYVNSRWLGGTLTNLKTIQKSIKKLWNIERQEKANELVLLPKKEQILIQKEKDRLNKNLSGIRYMRGLPQALFITDTTIEHNAIKEAKRLNIPVIAICDTNSDPDFIDYIIPANDDAAKTINLLTTLVADTVIAANEVTANKFAVDEKSNNSDDKSEQKIIAKSNNEKAIEQKAKPKTYIKKGEK